MSEIEHGDTHAAAPRHCALCGRRRCVLARWMRQSMLDDPWVWALCVVSGVMVGAIGWVFAGMMGLSWGSKAAIAVGVAVFGALNLFIPWGEP